MDAVCVCPSAVASGQEIFDIFWRRSRRCITESNVSLPPQTASVPPTLFPFFRDVDHAAIIHSLFNRLINLIPPLAPMRLQVLSQPRCLDAEFRWKNSACTSVLCVIVYYLLLTHTHAVIYVSPEISFTLYEKSAMRKSPVGTSKEILLLISSACHDWFLPFSRRSRHFR